MQPPSNSLAWIIAALGIIFLAIIVSITPAGVFFSGDGGVKYLMLQHGMHFGTHSPAWVKDIWDAGFFPVKEPFVYTSPKGRIFAFPPAFIWISKPFLLLFGFKGILLIPALSLLAIWFAFYRMVAANPLRNWLFAILVLGSPLTLYGALFWEHTTAVAFAFAAIFFMVTPSKSRLKAVSLGFVAGLSAWFRVEMLFFLTLISLATIYEWGLRKRASNLFFLAGLAIPIASFLLFNFVAYGSLLGAQSWQMQAGSQTMQFAPSNWEIYLHLSARVIQYFPVILLVVFFWWQVISGRKFQPATYQLLYVICCFVAVLPLFIPNVGGKQIGPRYLLIIVPAMLAIMATGEKIIRSTKRYEWLLALLLVYSFGINCIGGFTRIDNDYQQRVEPLLHKLASTKQQVIIAQNQYVVQELAAAFDNNYYFVAENDEELKRLKKLLLKQNIQSAFYISFARTGEHGVGAFKLNIILLKPFIEAS